MLRAEDRGSTRTSFELDSRNTQGEMTSQNIWSLGNRNSVGNYRPISLLDIFEKILEKLMYKLSLIHI